MMFLNEDKINILQKYLGQSMFTGSEIRFCCPYCEDSKHHLYMSLDSGLWICFRCNSRGNIDRLYNDLSIKDIVLEDNILDVEKAFLELNNSTENNKNISIVEEPPNKPLYKDSLAYYYLKHTRGLTDEQIYYYDFRQGDVDESRKLYLKNFIIIPDIRRGEWVYWIARNIIKKRYYNCPGAGSKNLVYHIDKVPDSTVFIAEGVFSAIALGKSGVATLGKQVSKEQINILLKRRFAEYYVAFDGDAKIEALNLAEVLNSWGADVRIIDIPDGEDPDSLNKETLNNLIWKADKYTDFDYDRLKKMLDG